ncbi:MAG: hypothetical protein RR662_03910 [Clostridia bacterium]
MKDYQIVRNNATEDLIFSGTSKEVAKYLGCSRDTIRVRAMNKYREKLKRAKYKIYSVEVYDD